MTWIEVAKGQAVSLLDVEDRFAHEWIERQIGQGASALGAGLVLTSTAGGFTSASMSADPPR